MKLAPKESRPGWKRLILKGELSEFGKKDIREVFGKEVVSNDV